MNENDENSCQRGTESLENSEDNKEKKTKFNTKITTCTDNPQIPRGDFDYSYYIPQTSINKSKMPTIKANDIDEMLGKSQFNPAGMNRENIDYNPDFSPNTPIGSTNSCCKKNKTEPQNNSPASKFSTIKLYDKNGPIWKFINKFIEDNSEELLLLMGEYDTDDDFFTYLSELLMDKISTETRLFKNLHRNTIKALPKVINAIFLLYFQEIDPLMGDELEKKSGMIGQYKKLRAIADHLGLELPYIMGDVVEKILEEKKENIFRGKFFPSQENVCRLDKRLTPSRKMVKTISRWIQKNSDYKNLTDLKERLFEKKPSKPKDDDTRLVLFDKDKDKNSMLFRNICDTIIEENPKMKSYNDITRTIDMSVTTLMKKDYRRYMKYICFLNLQKLYGRTIPHQIFVRPFRSDKWIFLWQDSEGNMLSDCQAKTRAGEYLIKEILKHDTDKYDIDYINNVLKRNDFISALQERKLKYNEILGAVGLELNTEPNRWEIFNWSSDGNPRTYEEAIENAVKYLKNLFMNENYDFQTNISSFTYLTNNHWDFLGALARNNLDYYGILTKAGFPDDKGRKKWKILDADDNGFLFDPKEQYSHILRFFRNKILPIYEEKGLIEDKIGPSYDEAMEALKNTVYQGFISSSNARGISLGELLRSVGLSPRVSLNQKVGVAFHWIGEYNFMIHTRIDNNCISNYEPIIHDDDENRPDNNVLVNRDFRDLSRQAKLVPKNIEWVNIDYYLFYSRKRSFSYKTDKYQSESSLLILVPLNIKSNIITSERNVQILSPLNFCKFFGFSEERKEDFINFARLALQATNKDNTDALNKLIQEAERCKKELTSNPKFNFKSK